MKHGKKKDWKKASLHSTMAVERQRRVTDLAAALAAQGDTAAASLEQRLATVLEEGEEMPDVRLLLRLLERLVRRGGDELQDADGDRFVRAMRLKALQQEARETKAELHGAVVKVRKALVDLYGSARVRFQFGLAERTPRGTADLGDEARRLAARLEHPELVLPEPQAAGLVPDVAGWVRLLTPPMARLERLVEERERRRVGASDGVLDQRRALAACDETHLRVARTAEALFRLAGEEELARRLRPKAKRRQRSRIVRTAASWWLVAVAVFQRLRGFIADRAVTLRSWVKTRETTGHRLARGFSKAPNV